MYWSHCDDGDDDDDDDDGDESTSGLAFATFKQQHENKKPISAIVVIGRHGKADDDFDIFLEAS